ncbi:MAG: hypothetical protein JWQ47_2412 [Glaciihabitans sp.]|nr:hypothetical protein [Glaciihabitans sp.]
MIVTEDRPRALVEGDRELISAEVLFAEARERGRRRRNRTILTGAVALAIVLVGTVVIVQSQVPPKVTQRPAPAAITDSEGFPTEIVAWDAPTAGHEGGIEVISSKTGKTLRTLVRNTAKPSDLTNSTDNPLAYVSYGFDLTNDGRTLYFNSGNEIESVSTSGGAVSRIAYGTNPIVSPDGMMLAYQPGRAKFNFGYVDGPKFAIKDLRTGQTKSLAIPAVLPGQKVTLAWLPDSHRLVIHASDLIHCVGGACLSRGLPNPAWSNTTQILDTSDYAFAPVRAATSAALDESASFMPQLDGAGSSGNVVRVSAVADANTASSFTEVGTLDVASGVLHWQYRVPAGFNIGVNLVQLPGQDSGTHFILNSNNIHFLGLHKWSPSRSATPEPVGKTARILSPSRYWTFA